MKRISSFGLLLSGLYILFSLGLTIVAKYYCSGWFCGLYITLALLPWTEMNLPIDHNSVFPLIIMFVVNAVIIYLFGAGLTFLFNKIRRK